MNRTTAATLARMIGLDAADAADLAMVAEESGCDVPGFVGRVIELFLRGDRPAGNDGASERAKRKAAQRLTTLQAWWAALKAGAKTGQTNAEITRRFVGAHNVKGMRIGRSTLYHWEKCWKRSGLAGLVDGRSRQQPADDPFMREARRIWHTTRHTASEVYRRTCKRATKEGWRVRSYKTVTRHLGPRLAPVKRSSKRVR